jgi:uncharacterized membrane protein (UPF0127 family)
MDQTKNVSFGDRIEIAQDMISRVKGLIGKRALLAGEGLFIPRCSSIHTFGMQIALDVVFVSVDMRIMKLVHGLRKNRFCACWNAAGVLELPVGMISTSRSEVGDRIAIEQ